MNGISAEYIKEFFEKKERKSPLVVKTRYGKELGEEFSVNIPKAEEWVAERRRKSSVPRNS